MSKLKILIPILVSVLSFSAYSNEGKRYETKLGCTIKGNIASSGEKIYHLPHQKYYSVTKISRIKGERYFCTEKEAKAAGWRKSKV